MKERRLLYFALGLLTVLAMGQVSIHGSGIEFPDHSFQATAAVLPAATAVQGSANANIGDFEFCSGQQSLYTVPAGKRLAIEWISVRIAAPIVADPVEVYITTVSGLTPINHPLVRLRDSEAINGSFFSTQHWHAPVRLYSDGGQDVQISACRDAEVGDTQSVTVTFSGHLVDPT